MSKTTLLFFVTEDWYFCSHRIELARAAKIAGYHVIVLTRVTNHGAIIRNEDFELIPLNIDRGGVNPLKELKTLLNIRQVYKTINPDIIHHVAIKPVIYGSLITLFDTKTKVVNLVAGFGAIFSSDKFKARMLKPFVKRIFKTIFNRHNSVVIVQNSEDRNILINDIKINKAAVALVKGSGVDIDKFRPEVEPEGNITVALVSRLLWDKGIREYIEAVKLLKKRGVNFTALLVGEPDDNNIASVGCSQLEKWQAEGIVECLGYIEDIPKLWARAHIAVLPSYREGLPKSLIEAAACARPIVTTDTSGCKEVVNNGEEGILVPVKDVSSLANALERLINDKELRIKMGNAARKRVEEEFSNDKIIMETLCIYQQLQ